MDMIEKVARAIAPLSWAAFGLADTLAHKNRRTASLRRARSAIEAMREPDDAMVQRAWRMISSNLRYEEVYRHMIDAALTTHT